jgi:hypothetical protein
VSVTEETAQGCITESEALAVTIEICESIEENHLDKLTIYPNPAKDNLNVIIETNEGSNAGEIFILNSFGQVMDKMDIKQNSDHLQFNISGYPAGVYFIRFKGENDLNLNSRFMVVK